METKKLIIEIKEKLVKLLETAPDEIALEDTNLIEFYANAQDLKESIDILDAEKKKNPMLNCYKCECVLDTIVGYRDITCLVFSDSICKVPNIIRKKFEKSAHDTITEWYVDSIELVEGLVIECE